MTSLASSVIAAMLALQSADVIQDQIERVNAVFAAKGYEPTGYEMRSELASGEEFAMTVPLRGGADYAVTAVCDYRCEDINLVLTDAQGKQIAADEADDDYPLVETRTAGTYRVKIVMRKCASRICAFAVRAYKR